MPLIPGLELPLPQLRQKAAIRPADDHAMAETGDALQGDEFRRTRHPYETIKLIAPVFTEALSRQIEAKIIRYELQSGQRIPPAYRFPKVGAPEASETWGTNKASRIEPVLWVFSQLEPVQNQKEAINQLACVIDRVEKVAHRHFQEVSHLYLPDPLPIRLPEPLPETVGKARKTRILVSYATRHVTIFKDDGAVQIQCTPERPEKLAYAERAKIPGLVILTKPGISDSKFWED